jgi:U3 small nucleolar RNA-associated protein 10
MFFFLREWRGELDKTNPEKNATKRYAFWSLSARLSKQLRSIFLPCLSMVVDEAVAELELAASRWCKPRLAEKRCQKKRRLESDNAIETTYGIEAMRVVQPLLLCLENSLRVDAHEGGNWVRADENQKYESLLDPLGKLLLSRVPPEFPAPETATSNFEYIIEGSSVEDGGSVVSCLTSLALAGGNEQLWKPLNHAVVQACGDEGRSEVRKAGLVCLLALMNTLGEEYMVLLPENLPILAELLEDSNEEVAGLAREVVTLAEDLIGESLEDSLR